jgi:hypothetical protein
MAATQNIDININIGAHNTIIQISKYSNVSVNVEISNFLGTLIRNNTL